MQSGGSVSPNPRMESHMMRLATFRNLPESSSLSPAVVSKAGFYYIGVGDTVACYSCGLRLNHMESGVHPMTVHQQFSPECQFVVTQQQPNVSAENTNAASSRGRQHHNAAGRQAHTHGPNRPRDSPTVDSSHRNTDRFTSKCMKERIDNNDPALLEEMKYERRRLSSYASWPTHANITPERLANAGLFYLCRADRVKCAFCGGILRNWGQSDDPMRKHCTLFPRCPFVRDPRAVGNVVLGNEPSEEQSLDVNPPNSLSGDIQGSRPKHPNKDCIKDRRATFQSWPPDSHTSPDKLAAAGFFYKDSTDDRYTCCFFCGGCIYDWQLDDDPMTKHHRHFPRCGFVKAIKQEHRQRPICPS